MNNVELKKVKNLKGELTLPPDKSISHRAIMFASLAEGESIVRNFLRAEDPVSTINAFRKLGIKIREENVIPPHPPLSKGGGGQEMWSSAAKGSTVSRNLLTS